MTAIATGVDEIIQGKTGRGRREPMTGPWKGARLRICVVEGKPTNVKKKRLDREKDVPEEIQSPEFKGETRV